MFFCIQTLVSPNDILQVSLANETVFQWDHLYMRVNKEQTPSCHLPATIQQATVFVFNVTSF